MKGFALHPLAAQDITEIWKYIAEDNPQAARVSGTRSIALFALWFHFLVRATDARTSRHALCASFWYANI